MSSSHMPNNIFSDVEAGGIFADVEASGVFSNVEKSSDRVSCTVKFLTRIFLGVFLQIR